MRLELFTSIAAETTDTELRREIGAVVARTSAGGGLTIEFGPADGAAFMRLAMNKSEAHQLRAALEAIIKGRDEEIVITEP